VDDAFQVGCDASPIDVQSQDRDRVISVPELGLAFETSMEMCGGTQQAADMRMHPLIVATCAQWAVRAENMALWLELTVILIWVSHCLSHEQQTHDCGQELDYLHRNKWPC
jgi:hypothetical protein